MQLRFSFSIQKKRIKWYIKNKSKIYPLLTYIGIIWTYIAMKGHYRCVTYS